MLSFGSHFWQAVPGCWFPLGAVAEAKSPRRAVGCKPEQVAEVRIQRDQDPIAIDGVPSHLKIRPAGKTRGSGPEHIERERGFRPNCNGDAEVLVEQEAHLDFH